MIRSSPAPSFRLRSSLTLLLDRRALRPAHRTAVVPERHEANTVEVEATTAV